MNVYDDPWLVAANKAIRDERAATPGRRDYDTHPDFEWPAARRAKSGAPECGTEEGYRRHLRWHELTCEPCKAAHRARKPRR